MKIAICANIDKHEVKQVVPDIVREMSVRNIDFAIESQLATLLHLDDSKHQILTYAEITGACELIISFGGDGTILSTAREVGRSGLPILGVKIGGMGFLAELTPEEFKFYLDDILAGNYTVVDRMVLQAEIPDENQPPFYALNDFVIDKGAVSRVNNIKTYIDDEFLNTFIGDGLIISTPTGSTAYSLAAGGPIMLPSMQAIIINPINPHSLGARPVVIPGDKEVKIELEFAPESVLLSADGQVTRALSPGNSAIIRKADHTIKLVSYGRRSFYDILRSKLNWGEDIRKIEKVI